MSKSGILEAIRKNRPVFDNTSVTPLQTEPLPPEERKALFIRNLQTAGGVAVELVQDEVEAYITEHFPDVIDFTKTENIRRIAADTPRQTLEKTEAVVFEGHIAVAENAAVWLQDSDLPHRILPFITQQLVLKIPESKIVDTMQEGYAAVNLGNTGFGLFVSGPSKTADIEQSLVYGAHGAVTCTVIIISGI